MTAPETPEHEGTLDQTAESRESSRELSFPKESDRNPDAPRIPGYILIRPLGRSAFAQVWRAWQVRTRKQVAVKVFTDRTGVNWLYLQREVERLIRLDKHPGIMSLLDADLSAEPPYYVTDLMEGGSLDQFIAVGLRPALGPAAGEQADRRAEKASRRRLGPGGDLVNLPGAE